MKEWNNIAPRNKPKDTSTIEKEKKITIESEKKKGEI